MMLCCDHVVRTSFATVSIVGMSAEREMSSRIVVSCQPSQDFEQEKLRGRKMTKDKRTESRSLWSMVKRLRRAASLCEQEDRNHAFSSFRCS
jgi:hypothetical protein